MLQPQPVSGSREYPRSDLHTDHAGERAFSEETLQELPFTATKVDHRCGPALGKFLGNTIKPLVVEPNGPLKRILDSIALRCSLGLLGPHGLLEPTRRRLHERPEAPERSPADEATRR